MLEEVKDFHQHQDLVQVVMEYKIRVEVEEDVRGKLLHLIAEDLVVPESSSSLILHKYSKNIQWA